LVLLTFSLTPRPVMASLPAGPGTNILTSFAASPNGGFWVQVDGGIDNDETAVRGRSRARRSSPACRIGAASPPFPARKATGSVTDKGAIHMMLESTVNHF
jgi:hypothetical protein